MGDLSAKEIRRRFELARQGRGVWESHWQECYEYALPQRGGYDVSALPGQKRSDKLFDGTAPDAVDQLAASLLAYLTPPWARWFGLMPGTEVAEADQETVSKELEAVANILQMHFDRSNFAVELHQSYLDLVTVGTACLMFEENRPGEASAFRFRAIPLSQVVMEEGASGLLSNVYRKSTCTWDQLVDRFGAEALPASLRKAQHQGDDFSGEKEFQVLEAVVENGVKFDYIAILDQGPYQLSEPLVLRRGSFQYSPFICFRWLKTPGENYGRSPVMKALPDIKTANKVVELSLKNAAISVTGIWQADDDGVLNPANIRLVPGAIIPKAVGSNGLTPLQAPGNFDLSMMVLEDLRKRIRHSLLTDKLSPPEGARMTATEVLERSAEMARILGATFGRLQVELLTPLVIRGMGILSRRGEVGDLFVDGRLVDLHYKSPLARQQTRKEAQDVLSWLQAVAGLGPQATQLIDPVKVARFMAKAYGVPADILKSDTDLQASTPSGGQAPEVGAMGDDQLSSLMTMAQEVLNEQQSG